MEHLKENKVPMDGETYRLGKKLMVDPGQESFVGDAQANALLTRPYRAPFIVPKEV